MTAIRSAVAGLAFFGLACSPTPTPPLLNASASASIAEAGAPPPNEEISGVARWVDQRGGTGLGVAVPEGQLTLVAGRRVLVGKKGEVLSVAAEVSPLTRLALVRDGAKLTIVGLAGNELWRFADVKGPGQRIGILSTPVRDIKGLDGHAGRIRIRQDRWSGPPEVWLNLEGQRVEPPSEPLPEPAAKPAAGESPVLRWVDDDARSPLVAAISGGVRVSPERALVTSGADLFEIDLKTGLPVAVRSLGIEVKTSLLTRIHASDSLDLAYVSAPSAPLLAVRWPATFTSLSEVEVEDLGRPSGDEGAPVVSSSGGVLWWFACTKGEMPPRALVLRMQAYGVCVRQPDGSFKSVFTGAMQNANAPATPTSDGGLVLLAPHEKVADRRTFALFRYDSESTPSVIARLPNETIVKTVLDELRPGEFVEFARVFKPVGEFRPDEETEFLRVTDGNVSWSPFGKETTPRSVAYRGGYAAITDSSDYRVSTNGGATWRRLPRPAVRHRLEDPLWVGELGLAEGGFVRLGWADAIDGKVPELADERPESTIDARSK